MHLKENFCFPQALTLCQLDVLMPHSPAISSTRHKAQVQGCWEDVEVGTDWLLFQKPQLSNRFSLNTKPELNLDVSLVHVYRGVPVLA